MKIYLDSDFRCHLTGDSTMRAIETDFFNGKCKEFVEGYRFVPEGESWTREDGEVFIGEMVSPAEDYDGLEKAQKQFERDNKETFGDFGIPSEAEFVTTRNYPMGSFLTVYGEIYETILSIPEGCKILTGQNVIKTTVEHYLDTLKEGE